MGQGVVKAVEKVLFGPTALTTATQRAPTAVLSPQLSLQLSVHRRVQVCVKYDAAAIGGTASIIPMGTCKGGDDVNINADDWYMLGVWDGSVTPGVFTNTLVATTAFTNTQNFGRTIVYPQEIRTPPAVAAADKIRLTFSIDVSGLRRIAFHVAEVGGGAVGTLTLSVAPYA